MIYTRMPYLTTYANSYRVFHIYSFNRIFMRNKIFWNTSSSEIFYLSFYLLFYIYQYVLPRPYSSQNIGQT